MLSEPRFTPGMTRGVFQPAWWLSNGHLQTLYPALLRRLRSLPRVRERLALHDGDWLCLDWRLPKRWAESGKPLVIIVHGLTGSSRSPYVVGLQHALDRLGWASVAMNCRAATGQPNDTPRAYHAGTHDDLADVLYTVCERYPGVPVAVVGYSLGGAITLNCLVREAIPAQLFAAATVSVPLSLGDCADRLDQGLSRLYRKHLLGELYKTWQAKAKRLATLGDVETAAFIRQCLAPGPFTSFRHYDEILMARLHGFDSAQDYYDRCSPRQSLSRIEVPTLVLQAADDPFLSEDSTPKRRELSPHVYFELSQRGGHVGFVSAGPSWREPIYYLESRIPDFLQVMLKRFDQTQAQPRKPLL